MGTTRTLPTPKKRLSRTRYENPTGSGGAVNPEKPPRKIILGGFWGIFGLLFWGFRLRHTAPIENTRPSGRPFLDQCHQVSRYTSCDCARLKEVAVVVYISYEHGL